MEKDIPGHPWMRGLSDFLSRSPARWAVSFVPHLGWTDPSGFLASSAFQEEAGSARKAQEQPGEAQGAPGEAQE